MNFLSGGEDFRLANIEEKVTLLAEPIAEALGLMIYDVEFKKEGPDYYLRVFIDKEDGYITIDDCEAVSRPLSDVLDVEDPIDKAYYLEVSSPGLERQLKKQRDFDRFNGSRVLLKLYAAIDGTKSLEGILKERTKENTKIEKDDGKMVEIPNEKISQVRLTIDI